MFGRLRTATKMCEFHGRRDIVVLFCDLDIAASRRITIRHDHVLSCKFSVSTSSRVQLTTPRCGEIKFGSSWRVFGDWCLMSNNQSCVRLDHGSFAFLICLCRSDDGHQQTKNPRGECQVSSLLFISNWARLPNRKISKPLDFFRGFAGI